MSLTNLARPEPFTEEEISAVSAQCRSELEAAGIDVSELKAWTLQRTEVPSRVFGGIKAWSFERAWRYWVAKGPGLPVEVAEQLHQTHGTQVRVAGHCGCPSPREWFHGFGVGLYHVDAQEGLNALAAAIRSVYAADEQLKKLEVTHAGN